MEYENIEKGQKMKTQYLSSDIISTLPQNLIENILSLLPIQDALRTSILSKKWRYTWRNMPKLEFTEGMIERRGFGQLEKYKLVNAMFHVLLLHNGPTILEFDCYIGELDMETEFAQIMSYLAIGNKLKELIFISCNYYKLPASFFSLQGLEEVVLQGCEFEPPITFTGFSRLKTITFRDVGVSSQMLQRFLSKCPLLEFICLSGYHRDIDFAVGEIKFTFVDLSNCVPLIRSLEISTYYMKYLSAGGMPHKLPTSLSHLKYMFLSVCVAEQNEISSILCIIRSSPLVSQIKLKMDDTKKLHVGQNPTNFLDLKDDSDLKLDHLEILEIECFRNLPLEMEFVKLIIVNSPVLKMVQIVLYYDVSVDEGLKMLGDLVRLPLPHPSPSAKLIFKHDDKLLYEGLFLDAAS